MLRFAGDPKFVSDIPEALKKNADVVFRQDEMTYNSTKSKAFARIRGCKPFSTIKDANTPQRIVGYDKLSKNSLSLKSRGVWCQR